jgi:hypothetical protein
MKIEKNNLYLDKMLGYVITSERLTNDKIQNYNISTFDILNYVYKKTIYIIKNNKIVSHNYFSHIDIFIFLAVHNHVEILNWLIKSNYSLTDDDIDCILIYASIHGNVEILEYIKNTGYIFKNTDAYIIYACETGHVNILKFFKKMKYTYFDELEAGFDKACIRGNVNVLNFLKRNGYPFKSDFYGIRNCKNIKTYNWYLKNNCVKMIIKIIKLDDYDNYVKTIKFKTFNGYFKGYSKN